MKKLLLINPASEFDINLSKAVPVLNLPPLNLGYIASLTPSNWEIQILDENIEQYKSEEADLVGLTAMTSNSPRAYELATNFKRKGIPTIMGGIHASMLPDEALRFVDSVVIGEAENVWGEVIKEFENNKLKPKYYGSRTSLERLVYPKRNLYSNKYKIKGLIQTTRGCPMNCEFCSVTAFNGGIYRQRPINEVLDELETIDSKLIFFIDDNIIGYGKKTEQRAIKLFKGIIDRGLDIKWGSQASINFADNKEVLKYAQKSGCFAIFIGFESLNEESLKSMHKIRNLKEGVKKYKDIVKKIQDYGIGISGSFIFGSDEDKRDIFRRTTEFVLDSKLDGSQFSVLTPLPGTRLYERLKKEGRLLKTNYPQDWTYYDVAHVVFRPKNMTPSELEEGVLNAYRETTTKPVSIKRSIFSFLRTKNWRTAAASYFWNRGYGSIFLNNGKN